MKERNRDASYWPHVFFAFTPHLPGNDLGSLCDILPRSDHISRSVMDRIRSIYHPDTTPPRTEASSKCWPVLPTSVLIWRHSRSRHMMDLNSQRFLPLRRKHPGLPQRRGGWHIAYIKRFRIALRTLRHSHLSPRTRRQEGRHAFSRRTLGSSRILLPRL